MDIEKIEDTIRQTSEHIRFGLVSTIVLKQAKTRIIEEERKVSNLSAVL